MLKQAAYQAAGLLCLSVLLSACGPYYEGEPSDHFDGETFFNPKQDKSTNFWDFLRWQTNGQRTSWPDWIENIYDDTPPDRVGGASLRISFVNHATVLIQTQNVNILTDPVWSDRVGPLNFIGPKRHRAAGITFDDLPKIDVMVLSHNHYDHLDLATIERLCERDRPLFLVPLGNDTIIDDTCRGGTVTAMDWNESVAGPGGVRIHLLPSLHWSSRGLTDQNKALWGAFLLETNGGNIYFAGDTGYGDGSTYREVAEAFGNIRLALLPIGAYEPRWFMIGHHMNPEDSVLAHKDLNAAYSMAIHFGTFQLSDEGIDDPVKALSAARIKHGVPDNAFRALENGEVWTVPMTGEP